MGRAATKFRRSGKAGEGEEEASVTVLPSRGASQNPDPAQAETPPTIQSRDSAVPKTLTPRVPLVVFVLMLIVGLVWFVGSKLSPTGGEASLPTPTPTSTSTSASTPSPAPTSTSTPASTPISTPTPRSTPMPILTLIGMAPAPAPAPAPASALDPALYYSRGWDFYQKQDYDKAISEYNEAIKLEPHNATYYFARGVAYLDTNDYDKAISDYNKAIRLEPNNAAAYNEMEKYDKAIGDYNKAIKLEPNFAATYYNRGITYRKQGKDARAQADFDKAKQLGYRGSQ